MIYLISSRGDGMLFVQDSYSFTGTYAGAVEEARRGYAATGRQTRVRDTAGKTLFKIFTSGNEVNYVRDESFRVTDATMNV
jgi:hypothetical protein